MERTWKNIQFSRLQKPHKTKDFLKIGSRSGCEISSAAPSTSRTTLRIFTSPDVSQKKERFWREK